MHEKLLKALEEISSLVIAIQSLISTTTHTPLDWQVAKLISALKLALEIPSDSLSESEQTLRIFETYKGIKILHRCLKKYPNHKETFDNLKKKAKEIGIGPVDELK